MYPKSPFYVSGDVGNGICEKYLTLKTIFSMKHVKLITVFASIFLIYQGCEKENLLAGVLEILSNLSVKPLLFREWI
jgi:hypothetical protein